MLELLNSNRETVDIYLDPLYKYFIRTCIKIEDQIKHRKAAQLLGIKDYIRQKKFYETDAEIQQNLEKHILIKKEILAIRTIG